MNFRELNQAPVDRRVVGSSATEGKPKSEPTPEQSHLCNTRPIWTPLGWGVDRKRLVWLITNSCTRNPKCFTCNFRSQYQRTRKELFPVLSRIQNIGYVLGENSRTAEWYRANHRTPWVAGPYPKSSFELAQNLLPKCETQSVQSQSQRIHDSMP
ncbi:hypothetical protein ETAA8_43480 [Anatilimnocola aggregata]|uniref:Uncharacterized protein n=1 Tax=Anatilimnocola aggregata TaxID=2528021 RepID=A0A517YGA9_9BACT|nr:hypothetical protein [Anatilimnocola aggregata]QDU29241.1 hypothetical protein ETAA8_43480 [Anatilimnocola aggregata]